VYMKATPLSPREAQRVYELDLSMRTTSSTVQDDADEKLYFPVKVIAKVMRKALPDAPPSIPKMPTAAPNTPEETKAISGENPTSSDDEQPQIGSSSADAKPNGAEGSADDVGGSNKVKAEPENATEGASRGVATASSHTPCLFADLPPIKLSDDAVALMQECATEFMLFLTSEARDHAALENPRKKASACSISGANVLDSLYNLGFSPYAKVLEVYNVKIKRMQDSAAQKKLERKLERKQQAKQAAADAKQALEKTQQVEKAVTSVVTTMVSEVSTSASATSSTTNAPVGEKVQPAVASSASPAVSGASTTAPTTATTQNTASK